MLLNLCGLQRLNLILVHHLSRIIKVDKKNSNLLLMFLCVIIFSMNYLILEILRFLILFSYYAST
jgi:hypothetical protein